MHKKTEINILIYRIGSMGDILISLPVLRYIKNLHPNASFFLLTNEPVNKKAALIEDILQGEFEFEEVLYYRINEKRLSILYYLYNQIKKEKFSFLYYVMPERGLFSKLRDFVFFKLSGIKKIVGLRLNLLFSNSKKEYRIPEALRLIKSITNADIDLSNKYWWNLNLAKNEIQIVNYLLETNKINNKYIVICPGTKQEIKDWGMENWLELIKLLNTKYASRFSIIFIGSKDEKERCEKLLVNWKGKAINLCGLLEPRISAAILSKSILFIGHDSGPMHLAASVNTPIIAIFSSRNLPIEWFPFGEKNKVFYTKIECMGCYLTECLQFNKACIKEIKPSEVYNYLDYFFMENNKCTQDYI